MSTAMYRSSIFIRSWVFTVLSATFILIRSLMQLMAPNLMDISWIFLQAFRRSRNISWRIPRGKFGISLLFFRIPFKVAIVILLGQGKRKDNSRYSFMLSLDFEESSTVKILFTKTWIWEDSQAAMTLIKKTDMILAIKYSFVESPKLKDSVEIRFCCNALKCWTISAF